MFKVNNYPHFVFSEEESRIIRAVYLSANELKVPAFLIGGYVRDKLLERPSKDIDFMCIGSGIALAEKTAIHFSPSPQVNIFKNFGTAMLKAENWDVEFVGARKESYAEHSRKPAVETGTLQDDLNRRDFTINTLAISLDSEETGTLIDPFSGLKHLDSKTIRTPLDPDVTFSDDPLRMMRAIRFATQLDFSIHDETFQSIRKNSERIKIISMERVTEEINKILLSPKPSIGFDLLLQSGILQIIFPEFVALKGAEMKEGIGHKDNFYHTLKVIDNVADRSNDLWLRWAAVLHDIAKPATKKFEKGVGWTFHGHDAVGARWVKRIFRHFKLPMNDKMKFVEKMVLLHLRPISLSKEEVTDSAIRRLLFEAGEDVESLMILCEADITSKNKIKVARYLRNFELVRIKMKEVEEKDHLRNWQPPVDGALIMQTFDLKQGREVGIIKDAIREAILDGKIGNNYEEAFQFMIEKAKEIGLTPRII